LLILRLTSFDRTATLAAQLHCIPKRAAAVAREVTDVAGLRAAAAGGSLSEIETTAAMTAKDAHATFVSAGKPAKSFRSAGRS